MKSQLKSILYFILIMFCLPYVNDFLHYHLQKLRNKATNIESKCYQYETSS